MKLCALAKKTGTPARCRHGTGTHYFFPKNAGNTGKKGKNRQKGEKNRKKYNYPIDTIPV
ncbi:MAG: hypothetical protein LBT46_15520 [Planctomycetaceae bacterium]|jgi:hypothetical protein|nr:hypothetical protein [Planctomycetaceae bacterium]